MKLSMDVENIFSRVELSPTELHQIAANLSNAAVKKYLRLLAASDIAELLALSAVSTDDRKLAMAHATIHGKLQVIETLLSITDSSFEESSSFKE